MTVESICDRIYMSMDRRSDANAVSGSTRPKLGWPGVSCEVWGAHGAFGGEVYGWGAVMPAHIIRNLIGFRESDDADGFVLSPGFATLLAGAEKRYGITGIPHVMQRVGVQFAFLDAQKLDVKLTLPESVRILKVTDAAGQTIQFERNGASWQFKGRNYESYFVKVSGFTKQ